MSKYKFGLKKSQFTEHEKVGFYYYQRLELPDKFDLRDYYNIVPYNQGNTNSCSANAICQQINIILQDLKQKIEPSRAFIYFNSLITDRKKEGSIMPIEDKGVSLRSAYESIMFFKVCEECLHKFDEDNICKFPSSEAYLSACKNNFISSFHNIYPSLYSFKYILSQLKKIIVFGMAVYSAFEELNKDNYILDKPTDKEIYLGLHGVALCGYSDTDNTFWVCNSHGDDFGLSGFFKIKNEYLIDPNLAFEFFTLNS